MPSPSRASTSSRSAAFANGTWRLTPVSRQPSPSGSATSCTPVGPEAAARLEPRRGEDRLSAGDARKPGLSLLVGTDAREHAAAHDRADEVGRGREARGRAPGRRWPRRASTSRAAHASGNVRPSRPSSDELQPELLGVADGVVLHLPHDVEARVPGAHAAHGLAQQLLLGREIEIHVVPLVRASSASPRRAQGLSSGSVGMAMRAAHSVQTSPSTLRVTSTSAHCSPSSSTSTDPTTPASTIVSPGNTEPFMRNVMRPSRPLGPVQSVR